MNTTIPISPMSRDVDGDPELQSNIPSQQAQSSPGTLASNFGSIPLQHEQMKASRPSRHNVQSKSSLIFAPFDDEVKRNEIHNENNPSSAGFSGIPPTLAPQNVSMNMPMSFNFPMNIPMFPFPQGMHIPMPMPMPPLGIFPPNVDTNSPSFSSPPFSTMPMVMPGYPTEFPHGFPSPITHTQTYSQQLPRRGFEDVSSLTHFADLSRTASSITSSDQRGSVSGFPPPEEPFVDFNSLRGHSHLPQNSPETLTRIQMQQTPKSSSFLFPEPHTFKEEKSLENAALRHGYGHVHKGGSFGTSSTAETPLVTQPSIPALSSVSVSSTSPRASSSHAYLSRSYSPYSQLTPPEGFYVSSSVASSHSISSATPHPSPPPQTSARRKTKVRGNNLQLKLSSTTERDDSYLCPGNNCDRSTVRRSLRSSSRQNLLFSSSSRLSWTATSILGVVLAPVPPGALPSPCFIRTLVAFFPAFLSPFAERCLRVLWGTEISLVCLFLISDPVSTSLVHRRGHRDGNAPKRAVLISRRAAGECESCVLNCTWKPCSLCGRRSRMRRCAMTVASWFPFTILTLTISCIGLLITTLGFYDASVLIDAHNNAVLVQLCHHNSDRVFTKQAQKKVRQKERKSRQKTQSLQSGERCTMRCSLSHRTAKEALRDHKNSKNADYGLGFGVGLGLGTDSVETGIVSFVSENQEMHSDSEAPSQSPSQSIISDASTSRVSKISLALSSGSPSSIMSETEKKERESLIDSSVSTCSCLAEGLFHDTAINSSDIISDESGDDYDDEYDDEYDSDSDYHTDNRNSKEEEMKGWSYPPDSSQDTHYVETFFDDEDGKSYTDAFKKQHRSETHYKKNQNASSALTNTSFLSSFSSAGLRNIGQRLGRGLGLGFVSNLAPGSNSHVAAAAGGYSSLPVAETDNITSCPSDDENYRRTLKHPHKISQTHRQYSQVNSFHTHSHPRRERRGYSKFSRKKEHTEKSGIRSLISHWGRTGKSLWNAMPAYPRVLLSLFLFIIIAQGITQLYRTTYNVGGVALDNFSVTVGLLPLSTDTEKAINATTISSQTFLRTEVIPQDALWTSYPSIIDERNERNEKNEKNEKNENNNTKSDNDDGNIDEHGQKKNAGEMTPATSTISPASIDILTPRSHVRMFHVDLKGMPPQHVHLLEIIEYAAKLGSTHILLEYEDSFPFDASLRSLRGRNAYSREEITILTRLCQELDLKLVLLIPSLGHMHFVLKHREFAYLRENIADPSTLSPSSSGSVKLVLEMTKQMILAHSLPVNVVQAGTKKDTNGIKYEKSSENQPSTEGTSMKPIYSVSGIHFGGDGLDPLIASCTSCNTLYLRPYEVVTVHLQQLIRQARKFVFPSIAATLASVPTTTSVFPRSKITNSTSTTISASSTSSTSSPSIPPTTDEVFHFPDIFFWDEPVRLWRDKLAAPLSEHNANIIVRGDTRIGALASGVSPLMTNSFWIAAQASFSSSRLLSAVRYLGDSDTFDATVSSRAKLVAVVSSKLPQNRSRWPFHGGGEKDEENEEKTMSDLPSETAEPSVVSTKKTFFHRLFSPVSHLFTFFSSTSVKEEDEDLGNLTTVLDSTGFDIPVIPSPLSRVEHAVKWLRLAQYTALTDIVLTASTRETHFGALKQPITAALPVIALMVASLGDGGARLERTQQVVSDLGFVLSAFPRDRVETEAARAREKSRAKASLAPYDNYTVKPSNMTKGEVLGEKPTLYTRPEDIPLATPGTWLIGVPLLRFPGALFYRWAEQLQAVRNERSALRALLYSYGITHSIPEKTKRRIENLRAMMQELAHFATSALPQFYFLEDIEEFYAQKLGVTIVDAARTDFVLPPLLPQGKVECVSVC